MVVQSIGLVTDLRSQNQNLGSLYQASGLSIEGDGSGGTFYWDATNTNTDDGVNVIQVTGTSTGRWIRISSALSPDGIVSGGIVTWTGTGLIFNVSACNYFINGVNYKTASTTITLDAADPTYDRIDVFAVNTSKQVVVIKGTPSANPIEPEGDTPTTLGLTNVTIAAGVTTPNGVTRNLIYDENTESWVKNFSTSNVSYNPIDSSQYYTGSVSIGATPSSTFNSIAFDFTYASVLNAINFKSFTFAIRLSSTWITPINLASLSVQFYNGNTAVTNRYVLSATNNVGFSRNLINQWQFISIAFNNTNIVFSSNNFTRVKITAANIQGTTWIDTICLNDGIGNPPISTAYKSFGVISSSSGTASATTTSDTLNVVGSGIATTSASGKTLTINVPASTSDGIVSGGIVVWKQVGYQYNVSPCVYFINGTQYSTVSTDVTLTSADPTYDRIDIIAVNSSNQVVVINGTPSANPVEPQVDPSIQLQLTNVTVYAGSSVPSGVTTNMIYDENTELWLKTPTGFTADYSNTVTPFYGTYCILATATTTGTKTLKFYKSAIFVNKTDCSAFSFAIKLNQVLLSTESIKILFANSSTGTTVATYSITSTNVVGFNRSNTSTYQVITIPISAITFSNNNFDSVTLQLVSSRTSISFRLDRMYLQGGINQPTGTYVSGTGTVNYVPKWDTTKSLTNSLIYDTGSKIGIGTNTPTYKLTVNGDTVLLPTGSTTAAPRTLGISGYGTGEAARWQFGDALNSIQNSFAGRFIVQTYWGMSIYGGRISTTPLGFETGLTTDWSLNVLGTQTANPVLVVTGATSQTGNLQQWRNSSNTVLASMTNAGIFTAASLIKSGGTSAQILAADGSVITAGANVTISGGTISSINIYNSNGSLTGNRTVTMGSFSLSFEKDIIINGLSAGKGGGDIVTNTRFGINSLTANTTGASNTAIGNGTLESNTTGSNNTAIGWSALTINTTGDRNTAIGREALGLNTTGSNSTAIGFRALYYGGGYSNTGIGCLVLQANEGYQNTAAGHTTLSSNSTGSNNTAYGYRVMSNNDTGSGNTAIGYLALNNNDTGNNNTAIGFQAGAATGVNPNITGSNNIFIGNNSEGVSSSDSNRTWIGNSSTSSTWLAGNLLLGTTTNSTYKIDVVGTARISSTTTLSSLAGTGSRMVIADATGVLSTQAITTGITSVGLTMPSAFTVSNSPLTSNGTIAVTGAGTSAQYIRGDGQLANFPNNGGGGSAFNYYLNGSVSQGTFGGDVYYEMNKTPVIGGGTNFTRTNAQGNGYIASFLTDAGDPSLLNIPGGNWNLEFYFQASSGGGSPQFYGELYKVSASNVFTLVASGSTNPEGITNGTSIDQYFTSISVPQTSLLVTDRLAIRIYVITSGKTITLHTENSNLCEVLTTFSTGLNALNGLTAQVQYFATGTSGTDFAISSATDTHTFNLPTASATNRGALSSADWTTFNSKVSSNIYTADGTLTSARTLTSGGFGLTFTGSNTASSAIARGILMNHTLVAAANSDVLVGLDINPTFTNGAFTGVTNYGARFLGNTNYDIIRLNQGTTTTSASTFILAESWGPSTYAGGSIIYYNNSVTANGAKNPNSFVIGTGSSSAGGVILAALTTSAPIRFFSGSGTGTEYIRMFGTGNLLLQNGGTFTDGGQRLQVNGTSSFTGTTATDGGQLGAELTTTGSGTNWSGSGFATGYTHTTGSVVALTTSLAAVIGNCYQIAVTVTGRTAGSTTIDYGGFSLPNIGSSQTQSIKATATTSLSITPTTDFDGTIVLSVKVVTGGAATIVLKSSGGTITSELRSPTSNTNLFQGVNSGQYTTSGINNSAYGYQAMQFNVSGQANTAIGYLALQSSFNTLNQTAVGSTALQNSIGSFNTALGTSAGFALTTGQSNTLIGTTAGYNITTGTNNAIVGQATRMGTSSSSNAVLGDSSGFGVTGNNNVFIGRDSGRYYSASNTAATAYSNSIMIGYQTKQLADNQTNQIVIGYAETGLGSNTTIIGNASTVTSAIRGRLLLGTTTDTGSYQLDVNGTARVSGAITFNGAVNAIGGGGGAAIFVGNGEAIRGNATSGGSMYLDASRNLTGTIFVRATDFDLSAVTNAITATSLLLTSIGQSLRIADSGAIRGAGATSGSLYIDACQNTTGGEINFRTSTINVTGTSTFTTQSSALVNIESTTRGFLPPRMTTTQKNAIATPAAGLIVYDTTLNKLCVRTASAWETITSL
jgi:hypothetical protein